MSCDTVFPTDSSAVGGKPAEPFKLNMSIHSLNPLRDIRWKELVERHQKASVFHTVSWLQALEQTYGFEPVVFTTSPPTSELRNGLVLCRVQSWITGTRLVSLPFSDHCEPLCDSTEDLDFLICYMQTILDRQNWKYLEVRPVNGNFGHTSQANCFLPAASYLLHVLDLRPDLDELFQSFDKDSIRRRIRRAERADLTEKSGNSVDLLKDFYDLFVVTRSRHHLPPMPYAWFRNLAQSHGDALEIRVAYRQSNPISGILTLRFRNAVYFKYGCSDIRFKGFGATPWLLWRAIVEARSNGATKFDMGRTEESNSGLATFKNHWVPQPKRLVYWKFPENSSLDSVDGRKLKMAKRLFSVMPNGLLKIVGKLFYRHIG